MIFDWKCTIYEFRRDNPSVSLLRSVFYLKLFLRHKFRSTLVDLKKEHRERSDMV